jgi:hypothetical protein
MYQTLWGGGGVPFCGGSRSQLVQITGVNWDQLGALLFLVTTEECGWKILAISVQMKASSFFDMLFCSHGEAAEISHGL